jgi:hypothetical protein
MLDDAGSSTTANAAYYISFDSCLIATETNNKLSHKTCESRERSARPRQDR